MYLLKDICEKASGLHFAMHNQLSHSLYLHGAFNGLSLSYMSKDSKMIGQKREVNQQAPKFILLMVQKSGKLTS